MQPGYVEESPYLGNPLQFSYKSVFITTRRYDKNTLKVFFEWRSLLEWILTTSKRIVSSVGRIWTPTRALRKPAGQVKSHHGHRIRWVKGEKVTGWSGDRAWTRGQKDYTGIKWGVGFRELELRISGRGQFWLIVEVKSYGGDKKRGAPTTEISQIKIEKLNK